MGELRLALLCAILLTSAHTVQAKDLRAGGKLLLTGGVSNVEGAGGGGIASWALITGYETRDGIGGNLHATRLTLPDYKFTTYGAAVGLYDRLELSYARQDFDTQGTGAKLGLGSGFTFHQDVLGAKLRVLGDAVYDQDSWRPQVAVGVQVKQADHGAVIGLLGGKHDQGVDWYVAASKVLLNESLVLNGAMRATKANQTGLLGFGGPGNDSYQPQFEGSAALLVTRRLAIGVEYRTKPSNLGLKEDDWMDIFAAFAISKNLSVTAAYADLGQIATFRGQRGLYLSLQAGF